MNDITFLHELDEVFEIIQEDDIKGEDILRDVARLRKLCYNYIFMRMERIGEERKKSILDGSD